MSEAANKTLSSKKKKLTCFKTPLQLQSRGSASLKTSSHFVSKELGGKHSARAWAGRAVAEVDSCLWCLPEQQSQ